MAIRQTLLPSFLHLLTPRLSTTQILRSRTISPMLSPLCNSILPRLSLTIPITISLNVPPLLADLWESILRAVPKKKTSHRKKRQRFMAGKALKDNIALNKCSACGNVKRAHLLCPYCVQGKSWQTFPQGSLTEADLSPKKFERC